MATSAELAEAVASLQVSTGALAAAQPAAFNRLNDRLGRLNAQDGAVLSSGLASGAPGGVADLPIQFVPGQSEVAALQFDLILPVGITIGALVNGPVANNAQKSASFNGSRVILFGLNTNLLTEGHLLTVRLTVSSSVLRRRYPIGISGVTASNPLGQDVIISGMAGPVAIQ